MDGYIRGVELAPSGSEGNALALVVLVGAALYCIPAVVAAVRKAPNLGSVVALNLFLGWTVVGWVAAFARASRTVPPRVRWRQRGGPQ